MSLPVPSEQTHLSHPKYRPDIDGLRAIAVLSVVGFHAFPNCIKGGFVGVDVFFIISGYLISSIILSNLDKGTFSFAEFYARRIKRIIPALIVVITTCFVIGWFTLLPDEYKQLGKHIAAGTGFVSNLFLWQEAGYFDNLAATKPLLHLWSLGIEEQYYIAWPLLLYLAWKQHFKFLILTSSIVIISFAINVDIRHSDPVQDFYSPVTRFWELMIGSLLAYLTLHKINLFDNALIILGIAVGKFNEDRKFNKAWVSNAQSLFGLLLIGIAVILVSKEKAFPGFWALLPTVGAYLTISAGQHAWLNRTLLSHRVMVWFGLISYPLYLWHWPLLSFARILEGEAPTRSIRISIVLISIALAWLTYKLIEKPIRFSVPNKFISSTLFILMTIAGSAGLLAYNMDGLAFRQIAQSKKFILNNINRDDQLEEGAKIPLGYVKFICPREIKASLPYINFCKTSTVHAPTAALVGDSHADHLFPGIPNSDNLNRWILLGIHSCPPAIGIFAEGSNPGCAEKVDGLFKYLVQDKSIKLVVLSFFGQYAAETYYSADAIQRYGKGANKYILKSDYASGREETLFFGLNNSIKMLMRSGKKVVISLDVPELPFFPRDCIRMSNADFSKKCITPRSEVDIRQTTIRNIVNRLKENHPNLLVYDPIDLFCTAASCYAFDDGRSYYRDSHHLSDFGSNLVGRDFIKWLSNQNLDLLDQ